MSNYERRSVSIGNFLFCMAVQEIVECFCMGGGGRVGFGVQGFTVLGRVEGFRV